MTNRLATRIGLPVPEERPADTRDVLRFREPAVGAEVRTKGSLFLLAQVTGGDAAVGRAASQALEALEQIATPEAMQVMTKLAVVQDKLAKQGRLGPVARLLPTTAATTLRKDDPPLVLDGPYAETKEQLLGFYLVDCNNLDEALDVARDLGAANPGGAYEIRPVGMFAPGRTAA